MTAQQRVEHPTASRPNILLLLTDQHRGDCMGLEGHPALQTPNLDYLANSGTHFRRGYSECPSCIPARRVLMSGQAPATNGMVGMTRAKWNPSHTLAGELSKAGYQTEMIGKLHLFPARKRYGFDHMVLSDGPYADVRFSEDGTDHNDYLDWLNEGEGSLSRQAGIAHGVSVNSWVGRPHHLPEHKTHTFWCVSKAMEFIDKRDPEAPFFLNVSFYDPHPPLTPPQLYYDRYINRDLPMPFVGDWAPSLEGPQRGLDVDASAVCLDEHTMRCARAGYYGLINFIDDQVGRLLNFLRRRRLLDNTFIMFASDHGEMLGDHNMFRKTFAYEPSARIPYFARPARTMDYPSEVVSCAPVGLQDVMPTLLDVAEAPVPETVTGASLLPLMRGDQTTWRDVLHGEHAGQYRDEDGMHYLTDGHRKYIWYSQTGQEHLFDLDEDPNELYDLALQDGASEELLPWRQRLATHLKDRPEGFSDGHELRTGRPHKSIVDPSISH